jgi:hypothetical protein
MDLIFYIFVVLMLGYIMLYVRRAYNELGKIREALEKK